MRVCRPRSAPIRFGLLLAGALLAGGCGDDAAPDPDAGSGAPPPAAPTPPPDPARVHSISPTNGPPGTAVTIRAGGLPAATEFEIGFGAANSNFEILGRASSDGAGELSVTLSVPAWAEPGRSYVFVVAPVNQPPRAASDTFRVTAPQPD